MREPNNFDNKSEYDFLKQNIPFLTGRPVRDNIIGESDIANLKIALNTTKCLEDFFRSV